MKDKYSRSDLDELAEDDKQAWLEVVVEQEEAAATQLAKTTRLSNGMASGELVSFEDDLLSTNRLCSCWLGTSPSQRILCTTKCTFCFLFLHQNMPKHHRCCGQRSGRMGGRNIGCKRLWSRNIGREQLAFVLRRLKAARFKLGRFVLEIQSRWPAMRVWIPVNIEGSDH